MTIDSTKRYPIWGLLIFTLAYVLIASEKFPRHWIALIGGGALILFGILTPIEALNYINWETLGLLAGMFILVSILEEAGFFRWLAMTAVAMWLFGPTKKPDPSFSVNGILAGLVAITAPCAFVESWAAVVIGLVAGVWACVAAALLEKLKIDDPVGAVPVHFFNGIWGVLAVGIFANGNPDTAAWNGVSTPVTGLLYGSGTQILAQIAEVGSIFVAVFGLSYVFFKVLNAFKLLRVSREVELAGLDEPEMGAPGYPKDWEPEPGAEIYSRQKTVGARPAVPASATD